MKGLWKEQLSGWNQKDSKRKKQNRNHTIKDNLNELRKTLTSKKWNNNNNNIKKEEYELIVNKDKYSGQIIENKKMNLYLIDLKFYDKKNNVKNIVFKGFFIGYSNKTLIDYKTKKEICDVFDMPNEYCFSLSSKNIIHCNIIKDLGFVENLKLDLEEYSDRFNGTKYNIKYHNTEIEHYYIKKKLVTYRYDPKTSKNLQNFTNRENRCKIKNYIKNGDFENEKKLPFKIRNNKCMFMD